MNKILNWQKPTLTDSKKIYDYAQTSDALGCDASYANVILYRNRYCTEIAFENGFLFRRYNCRQRLKGYGFPLGQGNLKEAVHVYETDAETRGEPLEFVLVSERQKKELAATFPDKFFYREIRDDADYIYLRKDLANLSGKNYHKKKNHVSQFSRKYPEWHFDTLSDTNKQDAWSVEEQWFAENTSSPDIKKDQREDLEYERTIIKESLDNTALFDLRGGVLYANGKPVAMTLGSAITKNILDTHFEKAISGFDRDGAYAAVNQSFAQTLTDFTYINREEDLGLEGLRHAKLSYHPEILLAKYTIKVS
jgi:hypothetical protein